MSFMCQNLFCNCRYNNYVTSLQIHHLHEYLDMDSRYHFDLCKQASNQAHGSAQIPTNPTIFCIHPVQSTKQITSFIKQEFEFSLFFQDSNARQKLHFPCLSQDTCLRVQQCKLCQQIFPSHLLSFLTHFKVHFIFPSRYILAIGLLTIFGLGQNLLPRLNSQIVQFNKRLMERQGPTSTGSHHL